MNTVKRFLNALLAPALLFFGRAVSRLIMRVHVEGAENLPATGPVIVIANHFSWFDAPLLTIYLPFRPAFLVANESQRFWFVRLFMRAFQGIPIWRGRVDRHALRSALAMLRQGRSIAIFPEGGIDPRVAEQRQRGDQVRDTYGHTSRSDGQLTYPQPGTAYLAVQSNVPILPVGLIGTEKVLVNLLRLRRTHVTVRIGPAFGPLELEPSLDKSERRRRLDLLAEQIMLRIAALFPPENRGPYRRAANAEMVA